MNEIPDKKNLMSTGNFARSLGVAKGIGRAPAPRSPVSQEREEDKQSRHKENR